MSREYSSGSRASDNALSNLWKSETTERRRSSSSCGFPNCDTTPSNINALKTSKRRKARDWISRSCTNQSCSIRNLSTWRSGVRGAKEPQRCAVRSRAIAARGKSGAIPWGRNVNQQFKPSITQSSRKIYSGRTSTWIRLLASLKQPRCRQRWLKVWATSKASWSTN